MSADHITRWTRRRLLQGMLGAGALALVGREAIAQSRGAAVAGAVEARRPLVGLPRHALVIGNSRYKEAPLRNPANDANAIAAQLKSLGFEVAHALDAGRPAMLDAIGAYGTVLERDGAIGLFYFAGHGVQLAWRNYLIPVDAVIDNPDDVRARAVELNALLQGLVRARNPMNVIILDACRDNPFGTRVRPDHKGLSQFDAPPGSLLAYATAPGNVASDGEGEHGLYTENLLREMRVPEAKVEDVFKRVRLAVRRRSNGLQIPWESTSLEEDFWFVPPRELRKLAEAEIEREFGQELTAWERVRQATAPEPLEDYLRRYPSGRFTELAQLQLDRVLAAQGEKRIEIVSAVENPYSKGAAEANTRYRVGDSYTYRVTDLYTKLETETFTQTITKITDAEVIYDTGMITDPLGNRLRTRDGRVFGPSQFLPLEFAVGKRWTTRFKFTHPRFGPGRIQLEMRITARENITVPAGAFDAFRLEATGWASGIWGNTQITRTIWLAPDRVRRWIASEDFRQAGRKVTAAEREELVSYRQS